MTRSKFRLNVFILPPLLLFIVALMIFITVDAFVDRTVPVVAVYTLLFILMAFIGMWVIFELRTKAVSIVIHDNTLSSKNFIGLGPAKECSLQTFDGFTTCIIPSRWNSYEYLYLMKDGNKHIRVSEFYHKNYDELKRALLARVEDLGEIPFSFSDEFREIFKFQ